MVYDFFLDGFKWGLLAAFCILLIKEPKIVVHSKVGRLFPMFPGLSCLFYTHFPIPDKLSPPFFTINLGCGRLPYLPPPPPPTHREKLEIARGSSQPRIYTQHRNKLHRASLQRCRHQHEQNEQSTGKKAPAVPRNKQNMLGQGG